MPPPPLLFLLHEVFHMTEVLDKKAIKALSVDTRLEIVKTLAKRPYTASELAKKMKKHVTTITEHLSVLEGADLIMRKESKNKWVYYELTKKGDHLFKPNLYSWTIVFAISLAALVGGGRFLFTTVQQTRAAETLDKAIAPTAPSAGEAAVTSIVTVPTINVLALVIMALGIAGIIYSLNKFRKRTF